MPVTVTCDNWLSLINSCIYDARQTCEIDLDFKALCNKTVLSKCSFMWNKRPVNILNDCKAQK